MLSLEKATSDKFSKKYNFNQDVNNIFSLIFEQGNYNAVLSCNK